jgi:DNA polymerase III sliding clamp (beta) subunit (PCNA family)
MLILQNNFCGGYKMSSFNVNSDVLKGIVLKASKGASNSKFSAITSLMNVVVENGKISVTTTDSNNYLTITDNIVSGEDTSFTVNVDTFSKLVAKTSVDSIKISVSDDMISFTGNGTYKLPIQLDVDGSPIKYPKHDINNPEFSGTTKTSVIKGIIFHNKPSLALTMEAPYLTGYLCTPDDVVSADSYNICLSEYKTFDTKVLLPPVVLEILSMVTEEDISYKIYGNNILFETSSMKYFTVMMDGIDEYPYDTIVGICKTDYPSNCVLPKTAVLNTLDRLSLFIKDNDINGVYMTFTDKGVIFESINNSGTETIPYQGSNNFKNYTCCVGVEPLKKQISAHAGESIELHYGGENSITIKDQNITQVISLMDDPRESNEE